MSDCEHSAIFELFANYPLNDTVRATENSNEQNHLGDKGSSIKYVRKIFRKTNISHTQLRNAFEAVYRKLLTKDLIKTSKCMIIRFKSHKFQSYF